MTSPPNKYPQHDGVLSDGRHRFVTDRGAYFFLRPEEAAQVLESIKRWEANAWPPANKGYGSWRDGPIREGWHFWRKRRNQSDPWKWHAYFVTKDRYTDKWNYWTEGTAVYPPVGGWWLAIPSPTPDK